MSFKVWDIFKNISTWVGTKTDIFKVNVRPELFYKKPKYMYLPHSGICINLVRQNIWGKDIVIEKYCTNWIWMKL